MSEECERVDMARSKSLQMVKFLPPMARQLTQHTLEKLTLLHRPTLCYFFSVIATQQGTFGKYLCIKKDLRGLVDMLLPKTASTYVYELWTTRTTAG